MMPESRKKKLAMLTRSIAKGDIGGAQELLRKIGHSAVNRHGKGKDDSSEVNLTADGTSASYHLTADGTSASSQLVQHAAIPLLDACPGEQAAVITDAGEMIYYLVRKTLAQVDPENVQIARDFAAVMRGARQRFDELEASAGLCHVANARPQDLLFMDIESCGLYGTSVFLVGLMSWQDEQLVFEQCLARTYAEEAAILHAFAQRLDSTGVLVTFNGKTFDMNMLRERSAFHKVDMPTRVPHLDLLYEARRRWRGRVPNCRLQTLEQHLCGRRRYGDIPGWAIPDAYHRFVDSGNARELADIMHHNLLDLLTMAQLVTIILTGSDPL